MSDIITGKTGDWHVVIGLEVHAQIKSESKLFSNAPTDFGGEPNTQVSLVDCAMPGMLPVVNEECMKQAIRTGLALNGQIQNRSVFARKNYFYGDLPQGYQISQYEDPIVFGGEVFIDLQNGQSKKIRIERLHVEQDAGKSIHDQHPKKSYIDLNRSGVGLMEIVSKPDISNAEEAAAYFAKLQTILRYIGSCDGNMAEGSMRADVNISVHRAGEALGTRTETKNVNSLRFIRQVVQYETKRQVEVIESGGKIIQETRLFDPKTGKTKSMRSKENAHDYRYFPDPDLPPFIVSDQEIDALEQALPELPDIKKQRFIDAYDLTPYDAGQLVARRMIADYFEQSVGGNAKASANWILSELFGRLNKAEKNIEDSPIKPDMVKALVQLIDDGVLSGKMAKDVFDEMFETSQSPAQIVKNRGLRQITDITELEQLVEKVLSEHPTQCEQYIAGKQSVLGWFVGQIMKASKGKANPAKVSELLRHRLNR
ncbi:MAG: Asp-tRNA(Asn)/Glu-tRNA(Gln) amidotransferase subunit GatB [Pseudomonadota bacterium]